MPTLAAASVDWHLVGLKILISWKVTNARLEERLAEFNDTVFPIDDLNTLAGTYREKYSRIRDLAYSIAQGNETGRSAAYTVTRGGRTACLDLHRSDLVGNSRARYGCQIQHRASTG